MFSGNQGPMRTVVAVGGLAFVMAVLAVLGWLLGDYLDRRFGTTPWLGLVGTLTGVAAGIFELYIVAQRSERSDKEGRNQ